MDDVDVRPDITKVTYTHRRSPETDLEFDLTFSYLDTRKTSTAGVTCTTARRLEEQIRKPTRAALD